MAKSPASSRIAVPLQNGNSSQASTTPSRPQDVTVAFRRTERRSHQYLKLAAALGVFIVGLYNPFVTTPFERRSK